jgi:hypothetical protein
MVKIQVATQSWSQKQERIRKRETLDSHFAFQWMKNIGLKFERIEIGMVEIATQGLLNQSMRYHRVDS